MKVQSIKSYINFASVEKEPQKAADIQSADAKKEKREKNREGRSASGPTVAC